MGEDKKINRLDKDMTLLPMGFVIQGVTKGPYANLVYAILPRIQNNHKEGTSSSLGSILKVDNSNA